MGEMILQNDILAFKGMLFDYKEDNNQKITFYPNNSCFVDDKTSKGVSTYGWDARQLQSFLESIIEKDSRKLKTVSSKQGEIELKISYQTLPDLETRMYPVYRLEQQLVRTLELEVHYLSFDDSFVIYRGGGWSCLRFVEFPENMKELFGTLTVHKDVVHLHDPYNNIVYRVIRKDDVELGDYLRT